MMYTAHLAMLQRRCCLVSRAMASPDLNIYNTVESNAFFTSRIPCLSKRHMVARAIEDVFVHADGLSTPVTAERASQSRNAWGQACNDSYAWLQDKTRSNPEVLAYLEQVCSTTSLPYNPERMPHCLHSATCKSILLLCVVPRPLQATSFCFVRTSGQGDSPAAEAGGLRLPIVAGAKQHMIQQDSYR
jgi:hypothetical protein